MVKHRWYWVRWENRFGKFSKTVTGEAYDKLIKELDEKSWTYKVIDCTDR